MALHPQSKAFLDALAASGGTPLEQLPVAEARIAAQAMVELGGPVEQVAEVENRIAAGPAGPIRVRVYRPALDRGLPAVVFFHGGGFVICDLESHDRQCRALANASGCVVIAVDYRLAPEHTFPAAVEDAYAATKYVAGHASEFGVDPHRIAVAGDSAGGNLAAVVALMAHERGGPPLRFQLLIYPMVDMDDHSPSLDAYGEGHFLTRELIEWFTSTYVVTPGDRHAPYVSPLRADDVSGLPPAMIITAECDPVRDQGEAYALKLQDAGVPVELKRYDGMIHPFFNLGGVIDAARVATTDAGAALRRAMGTGTAAGV